MSKIVWSFLSLSYHESLRYKKTQYVQKNDLISSAWIKPCFPKGDSLGRSAKGKVNKYLLIIVSFLEEFVAHGHNVNCLSLGPASGHVMVTGGDDRKVNMWALGKPNVIMVCNADLLFHDIYTFDRTDFHDKLFSWIIVIPYFPGDNACFIC